ncbi:DUF6559 family protein [sulfur-oxidizing endosymbiont of Gigantopelta aegis]|uniref:DUF6559 family protein n=1 Tax=sulfur-oxidizing endosymbiont of Gigantopelta aegis TaxID=2794934 RepID=UPI0018DB3FB1|nr:hypothetical protein [sulfur-oxidizing endosymbiont of Gigantopelta aegis]
MLKLLANTRQYLAQRAYHSKLPYQLRALYGDRVQYTPTQITIAIRKAGLCVEHRQLAYEMYLSKEEIIAFRKKSNVHRSNAPLPRVTLNKSVFN